MQRQAGLPYDIGGSDNLAQAFRDFQRLLKTGFGHQHHELLAAHATDNIDAAQRIAQDLAQFPQNGVTRLVAIGIVDVFEAIDIEHEQGKRMAIALHMRKLGFTPLHEMAPVGQAG